MGRASEISDRILLPGDDETVAISAKVKTTALCFDRVWGTGDDVVPHAIRVWGGSDAEFDGRGLAVDFGIKTSRAPIAAMIGPDDKKLQMMRAATDEGFGSLLREIACSFAEKHHVTITPVFDRVTDRTRAYHEGRREVVTSVLSNLAIVDEESLSWDQVIEFRNDEDAKRKYRRFLHWLDKDMEGRSQHFIEDEIAQKLEDYGWAIKKHGVKTILGTIEEVLDGKYVLTVSGLAVTGGPMAALVGGLLVAGRVAVKLLHTRLDYDDVEKGANSEISWVYEAKGLTKACS
ncbi:MAG: hypothetical protein JW955_02380 [Sedimentisphaerales bacterium]|nr:hypothetical protein [Sedimentisphaerales bacterium]